MSGKPLFKIEDPVKHFFPLLWLLVIGFVGFGLYITWDLGFMQRVYAGDRSYLTSIIALLTLVASVHAIWYTLIANYRLEHLEYRALAVNESAASVVAGNQDNSGRSDGANLAEPTPAIEAELEIVADRLRAPVEFGWFLVDLAIRLGLAGTIIGFILIFTSLSGEAIVGENALRELLVSMSAGMGTALFTTLVGLSAATFLSFQYLILGRVTEHLISKIIRFNLHYPQAPEGLPAEAGARPANT